MKKYILHILFLFVALDSKSQDTIYLDANMIKQSSSQHASYFKILLPLPSETYRISESIYLISGQLFSYKEFNDYKKKIFDGKVKNWYENGQLYSEMDYENGKLNGKVLTYWDDGNLKREDTYRNDSLLEGKCFNPMGNPVDYYALKTIPEFPGGEEGLYKYLSRTIIYPERSRFNGVEGRVVVSFIVDTEGIISDIQIEKSLNEELDEEAVRVVENMPRWIPGKIDNVAVRFRVIFPLLFTL